MKSICIAILGTDGSGKTTIINALTPELETKYHCKVSYLHLRPHWLPPLGSVAGNKQSGGGGVVTEPHALAPSGFVVSLIRLFYYLMDYTMGYWKVVRPKLRDANRVLIFDRYHYDFLIDPRRMRIALPSWLIAGVLKIAPEPDYVFCLGADHKVIFERKPETSLDEVNRQTNDLRALCEKNPRAVWIDTGESVATSCDEVFKALKLNLI